VQVHMAFAKDVFEKIERYNIKNGKMTIIDDSNNNYGGLTNHDDEYYLDIGSFPPRFVYYRHVRRENLMS